MYFKVWPLKLRRFISIKNRSWFSKQYSLIIFRKMKNYIYRDVRLSLQNSNHFSEAGLARAKRMTMNILEKGISPETIHLIFCQDGFICPGSTAGDLVLEMREALTGKGKFWVSKKRSGNRYTLTILLISLFFLAFFADYRWARGGLFLQASHIPKALEYAGTGILYPKETIKPQIAISVILLFKFIATAQIKKR